VVAWLTATLDRIISEHPTGMIKDSAQNRPDLAGNAPNL
jgi:hypothetical protein